MFRLCFMRITAMRRFGLLEKRGWVRGRCRVQDWDWNGERNSVPGKGWLNGREKNGRQM